MILEAIIEIPKNSQYKYEVDKKDGTLLLDRVINQRIPFNYGFIPKTLCEDGDPLDVFVVSQDPIPSLTKVQVEIFGVLKCKDNGVQDDKLVGRLSGDPSRFDSVNFESLDKIMDYLNTYKPNFIVESSENIATAVKVYSDSKQMEYIYK